MKKRNAHCIWTLKAGPSSDGPDPLPLIAGIFCENEYTTTALDVSIERIAERPDVDFMPLNHFLEEFLDLATFEERRIVFWTSHEKTLLQLKDICLGT